MARDKIAVAIKEATGWSYTKALHFRRNDAHQDAAMRMSADREMRLVDALVDLAIERAEREEEAGRFDA
jgi:hypothetical protein